MHGHKAPPVLPPCARPQHEGGAACIVDAEWAVKKMDDAAVLPACAGSLSASITQCRAAKTEDKCSAVAGTQCAWCVPRAH